MSTPWVYRYEIKDIARYVFATSRLTEVAGASAMIDALGRKEQHEGLLSVYQHAPPGAVRQAGAGGATLWFEDREKAGAFAATWPMKVARALPGVSLTWALAELKPGWLREMQPQLRARRNLPLGELPEATPLMARSGRTGLGAVDDEEGLVDRRTHACQGVARQVRQQQQWARRLRVEPARFATDLPGGSIALAFVDGNKVGSLLQELLQQSDDLDRYGQISSALADASMNATRVALEELRRGWQDLPVEEGGQILPFRPILIGGDDGIFLTRARDAWRFTRVWLSEFQRSTAAKPDLLGRRAGITASAAIVIAQAKSPFHALAELGGEMLKWAKDQVRERGAPAGITLYRIRAGELEAWRDIGQRELAHSDERFTLTGAPYVDGRGDVGLPSMEDLERLAQALRGVPRGSLREWLRQIMRGPERALVHLQRMQEVAKLSGSSGGRWAEVEEALRALGVGSSGFGRLHERMATPLLDAAELAGLVEEA